MTTSVPLKHLTTVLSRGSAPDYVDDGPVRMISQAANQHAGLDWERTRFHRFVGNVRNLRGHLEAGDVLVNSTGTGTLGRIGWFESAPDTRPCVADGHVTVVRFDPTQMHNRFGYYYLKSDAFQELMFETLVSGSTNQIELNGERMRSVVASTPELDEQRRIAEFLDAETNRIDRISESVRCVIQLLDERKAALLDVCVTGRDLAVPRVSVGTLGDFPSSWDLLPLCKVVPRVGVGVVVDPSSYFSDSGVPFLHGSNVREFSFALQSVKYMSESDCRKLWRSQLETGDVVVVRAGYPGRAAVIPPELDGSNCASILIVKRGDILVPEFVACFFNSPLGKAQVEAVRYGAAQEQINVGHVVDFLIPVPSRAEQIELLQRLTPQMSTMDAALLAASRQLDLLAERRQALITAAVTGQFDVTTARSGVHA